MLLNVIRYIVLCFSLLQAVLGAYMCDDVLIYADAGDSIRSTAAAVRAIGMKPAQVDNKGIPALRTPFDDPYYCTMVMMRRFTRDLPKEWVDDLNFLITRTHEVETDEAMKAHLKEPVGMNFVVAADPGSDPAHRNPIANFGVLFNETNHQERLLAPAAAHSLFSTGTLVLPPSSSLLRLSPLRDRAFDGHRVCLYPFGHQGQYCGAVALQAAETNTRILVLPSRSLLITPQPAVTDLLAWVTQRRGSVRVTSISAGVDKDDGMVREENTVVMGDIMDVRLAIEGFDCGITPSTSTTPARATKPCAWSGRYAAELLQNDTPQITDYMIELNSRTNTHLVFEGEAGRPAVFAAEVPTAGKAYIARVGVNYNRLGLSRLWGQVPVTVRFRMMSEYPRRQLGYLPLYVTAGVVAVVLVYLPVLVAHSVQVERKKMGKSE